MSEDTSDKDRRLSAHFVAQEGLTKQEGKQDFRPTERGVMSRDTSNLNQNNIRRTWLEGGQVHYSIGGQEVPRNEFFKKK